MSCIKTGCYVHLTPHDQWAYGDAFEMYGITWFRFCEVADKPLNSVKHFTVEDWAVWYDEIKTSQRQNSTMICDPYSVTNHGYAGIPV